MGRDASPSQGYPSTMSAVPIYTPGWTETMWDEGFLSYQLGVEPPTFRSEVQGANHYTTAPTLRSDNTLLLLLIRALQKNKSRLVGPVHFVTAFVTSYIM